MKLIKQIAAIGLIYIAGVLLGKIIPFPSPLLSMILFTVLLMKGVFKEDIFQGGLSDLILKNLAFFFLPPSVRVLNSLHLFEGVVFKLIAIMLISNVLVMGVTGMVTQAVLKKTEPEAPDV